MTKLKTPQEIAREIVHEYSNPPVGAFYTSKALVGMIKRAILERDAQVKEACARLSNNPYGDEICAFGDDEPSQVGEKIAKAIRALDLSGGKDGEE